VNKLEVFTLYYTIFLMQLTFDGLLPTEVIGASALSTYIIDWTTAMLHTKLAETADIVIKQLQSLQNTVARLVSGTIFRDHYHYATGFQ